MARITLIRPAYSATIYGDVYNNDAETRREVRPPLGLMAIAGYLKHFGHEVQVIDGEPQLLTEAETTERVLATDPDFVGITSTTPEYPFAHGIVRRIKEARPDIVTVFGGAHITNLPEHTIADLDPWVDWGVLYEGEKPMAAIIDGRPHMYRWKGSQHDKLLMAEERLSGDELDSFVPDRDVVDMSNYRFVDTSLGLVRNDALEMARGCPFGCAFCTSRRTTIRSRSIDSLVKEIVDSATTHGTQLFMFFDDTFTIHRGRAEELFTEILRQKRLGRIPQEVHLSGFTRADTLDPDLVDLMRRAGCDKLSIGVETGNEETLKAMMKGTVLDDYRRAYAMLEDAGISKRGSFIIGHPYDTEETIQTSIDFAIELDLDEIGVNIMTPYPGQQTFRDAMEARGIWFAHPIHYAELRESSFSEEQLRESWSDYLSLNWHDYWRDHLRWGRAVVETETLSAEQLVYWHGRFLQEVYGSANMERRRRLHIEQGNDDDYWHRPWRVHSQRLRERLEQEARDGVPAFPPPRHHLLTYDPPPLRDYQKNELMMPAAKRRRLAESESNGATPVSVQARSGGG